MEQRPRVQITFSHKIRGAVYVIPCLVLVINYNLDLAASS